jgi:hypothetical protein
MKKIMAAFLGLVVFTFSSCKKNVEAPATSGNELRQGSVIQASAIYYDFVIDVQTGCAGTVLTINDCGDASYTPWQSTTNCSGTNRFNGTVIGSGNPLLLTQPATFTNLGVTYLIFNNNTSATRDVLNVTFKPGYNASHKPSISYNATTRKFKIINAGNPAYVTVSIFSYTGIIAPGIVEFC